MLVPRTASAAALELDVDWCMTAHLQLSGPQDAAACRLLDAAVKGAARDTEDAQGPAAPAARRVHRPADWSACSSVCEPMLMGCAVQEGQRLCTSAGHSRQCPANARRCAPHSS